MPCGNRGIGMLRAEQSLADGEDVFLQLARPGSIALGLAGLRQVTRRPERVRVLGA
jgi:hypothetical protein